MAEFIAILQDTKQLPPGLHIFCPRQNDDDLDRYEDEATGGNENSSNSGRQKLISEAKIRREQFVSAFQLLAYDGEESEQYQRYIWDTLNTALSRCDICIREYYVAKANLMVRLREEYEEEDINSFFSLINRQDIARIKRGLDAANATLKDLPESKRGTGALDPKNLHAVFEALICEPFLQDENLLQQHFDEPFRLLQTKKPLKMREIMPATTRFLFDSNRRRVEWATMIWARMDRSPTELEWNWAIKDHVQHKLRHITDPSDIARFWSGLRLIVKCLDERQITHKLFDLVPNVAFTALDHLAKRTQAVPFIAQTIHSILDKAPSACWQAWGSISSQTVIEQIFASPNFNKFLEESSTAEKSSDADVLSWIPSFLESLLPGNRPSACRVLVNQLFPRIDDNSNSIDLRRICFEAVVKIILQTIMSFSDNEKNRRDVARLVLSDTLDIISQRIQQLISPPDADLAKAISASTKDEVYSIVRNSLNLECQCLKADFETLSTQESLQREAMSFSPNIWETILKLMHQDNVRLSSQVLLGVMPLPGLEQFRATSHNPLSSDRTRYNSVFEKLNDMVSKILERLSEFRPSHLDELFKCQETCFFLVAALFSADANIYQAGIDLIKNISGESGRKEALAHLIDAFFTTTIYSICWTFRRISNMQTFSSVPRMLKTGMELLDVLCNPSSGRLRSQKLDSAGFGAIQSFWSYQWIALRTIFKQTEQWSLQVYDKPLMTEVCRDAMQYAGSLFEQYDLFASILGKTRPETADDVPKILLNADDPKVGSPLKTLDVMSKWLRLRDEYLADTLVKLIVKMLYRLKQHDVTSEVQGLNYIVEVAVKSSIKTILSAAQKAMLIRALENFTGKTYERPAQKKQSTLKNWTEAGASRKSGTSTPISVEDSPDEFGDSDIADEDLSEISSIAKKTESSKAADRDTPKSITPAVLAKPRPAPVSLQQASARKAQEAKAFIENRKREVAARKQRDKEAAQKLKGKYGLGGVTKGQGSGLDGLGVKGKDHSTPASELMVSSDSDSESDSDEELFGKVQTIRQHGPGQMQTVRKALPAGPVKKIKQIRSQKDIRARLAPDLSTLHQTILSWDFFADTDLPPNADKDNYSLVTNSFTNPADYQKTFGPLLILESWQSFRSAREDGSFKSFEIKVSNSLLVDNFFEVNCLMPHAASRELGLNVADVVLFSKAPNPHDAPKEPHCLARVKEITRKKGEVQLVFRLNASNNALRSSLTDNSTVFGITILSLTPLEREYGALMALPYYDLCDEIITAKPSPLLDYSENELVPFQKVYSVNTAQAKAIKSAMDNDAFTLIQGPPGSGKTKTICAIVGAMLTGHIKTSTAKVNNSTNIPAPPSTKKLLVCAPSNAAVDELVMRFRDGIILSNGQKERVSIVRLGRSEIINSKVKDVTLEELVNQRLNSSVPKLPQEDIHAVMMEHKSASDELISVRDRISELRNKGQSIPAADEQLVDNLKRKKMSLGTKIDDMREKQNTATRDAELNRRRVQQEILDSAHVLCATLSGSGHEIFQGLNVEFETVIIDEAAQSIELSALIPLKYGCSKCILVGDPKQLPPTVLSREAAKFQYEQSLFARMEKNHRKDVHLLDTQYRMHPEISSFPSKTFYDSRLKDGPGMAKLRSRVWHKSSLFAPYRFFDVQGMSESQSKGHSLINVAELEVAMQMYHRLITDIKRYDFSGKIGIITPYKGQLKELKLRFRQRYGEEILSRIDFNTTDAFQGRESEIIIFSCVRASTKGIGFLNDIRRMNVGLTRAKSSLWVLGNSQSLVQGEFWRALVNDAKNRNLYTEGDILGMLNRPQLTPDMIKDDIEMGGVVNGLSPDTSADDSISDNATHPQDKPSVTIKSETTHRSSEDERNRPASADSSASSGAVKSRNTTPLSASNPHNLPVRKGSFSVINSNRDAMSRGQRYAGPKQGLNKTFMDGRFTDHQLNPDGPSGGKNGLTDYDNCLICGSADHQTHNCDNDDAKTAARGNCDRCKHPGHSVANCDAVRCGECGDFGHQSRTCKAAPNKRLMMEDQANLARQEARFEQYKVRSKQRRIEKQMEDRRPSIPSIKSTSTVPQKRALDNIEAPRSNDEYVNKRQGSFSDGMGRHNDSHQKPVRHIDRSDQSHSAVKKEATKNPPLDHATSSTTNRTGSLPPKPHVPRSQISNNENKTNVKTAAVDGRVLKSEDNSNLKNESISTHDKNIGHTHSKPSTVPPIQPMKKKKKRDDDLFMKRR